MIEPNRFIFCRAKTNAIALVDFKDKAKYGGSLPFAPRRGWKGAEG